LRVAPEQPGDEPRDPVRELAEQLHAAVSFVGQNPQTYGRFVCRLPGFAVADANDRPQQMQMRITAGSGPLYGALAFTRPAALGSGGA
jgi:hypothetical protein